MCKTHLPTRAHLLPGVHIFVYDEVKGVTDQDVGSGLEDLGYCSGSLWLRGW